MKKSTIFNSIVVIAILVLAFFQFKPNNKVAYIEINQVLVQYNGIKDAMKGFEQKKVVWEANIDTLRMELEEGIQEYEKNGQKMSVKERLTAEEALQYKQKEFLQYSDAIQQKLKAEQQEITKKALEPADKIIKEYGKKNGYAIILGASQLGNILYADEAINLTDKIIDILNKEYAK